MQAPRLTVCFGPGASASLLRAESGQSLRTVLSSPGGKVTVLHVKEKIPNHAISYIPADYETNLKAAIRGQLEGLAAQFENGAGVFIEGHSGQTILELAEANQVDWIVIISHRPGLQDYFLGSTAGRNARYAQCSVQVIR